MQGGGGRGELSRRKLGGQHLSLERIDFVAIPGGSNPGFDNADIWLGAGTPRMYVAHMAAVFEERA